jgi:predicted MPP superfamily phosphohydrolase
MSIWKILLFLLLVQTPISLLVHWTVGSRAVFAFALSDAQSRLLWIFLGAMMVAVPAALVLSRGKSIGWPVEFGSWLGYGWMGLVFVLFASCLCGEVLLLLPRLALALAGQDPTPLLRGTRGAALVLGFAGAAWGVRSALASPTLHEIEVRIPGLPTAFDGYRVAHLSDTHISALVGRDWAADLARRVDSASPDLVVHTGDLVDGTVAALGPAAAELLRAKGRDGAIFVTGNHETYSGAGEWVAFVESRGWTVLRNRNVALRRGNSEIRVAGLPDVHEGGPGGVRPDPDRALEGIPAGTPILLLAHQPVQARSVQGRGISLQLSGHTHGGQIWPFNHLVPLQQPLVEGFGRVGDVPVFTTRGAGFWGPPLRLFAPAEVPVLVLRPGA